MSAADSLPADRAENAPAAKGRSGLARPVAGGSVTLAQVETAVRADAALAWRLADPAEMQLRSEEVTWPDGALGCPKPGMSYTQALQPGWRLIVTHQGREAVYHASRTGYWALCAGSRLPPTSGAVAR